MNKLTNSLYSCFIVKSDYLSHINTVRVNWNKLNFINELTLEPSLQCIKALIYEKYRT